ncbi:MAG: bifunctional hydroxymethylpyrimidine kinase/phosphomethylpyrimidine kinase [Myxococcota bacterium]
MTEAPGPYPVAISIAGSDSGGGAGIQADLATFLDHGVFGTTAITAITAQNSHGVRRVDPVPVEGVVAQLRAVFDDFGVGAVKIGMLGGRAHVDAVADFLEAEPRRPPIVLDPVMVASTGHRLLDADAESAVALRLLPLAAVATPNLDEAGVLAGAPGRDAALAWARSAPCPVLITGGDTAGDEIVDQLVGAGDRTWRHPRVGVRPFHGTGCTLSSAIAARLARGEPLVDAIDGAIGYVGELVRRADRIGSVGHGNPCLPRGGLGLPRGGLGLPRA